MRVLAFDTSAGHVSASLIDNGQVCACLHEDMARGQAERLMPLLQEVLSQAGMVWKDLDRIGVGVGPGNFTGIRISVSAARGLSLGLGIPAIGVSCLAAQALELNNVISCLPAPRDQAYIQLFSDKIALDPQLCKLAQDEMPDWSLSTDAKVVGPNADAVAKVTTSQIVQAKYPLAEAIARCAASSTDITTRAAPLYLKPADAAPARDLPPVILP